MRHGVGSTRARRARQAVAHVGFVVILVAGLVGLVGPVGARPGPGDPRIVELGTNHASVSAVAFDGGGDTPEGVVKEATDVSAFSESVTDSDASTGRGGIANASQSTAVDSSDPLVTRVTSVGDVGASYNHQNPGDGFSPSASSSSEFSITFQVTDAPTFFSLIGVLSADAVNAACTTVKVTPPTGAIFQVAAPSCGLGAPPGVSIQEGGKLQPGTYTFSVVANAGAEDPAAPGGSAEAFFSVGLDLGCSITGTPNADTLSGTAEDDFICGLGGDDTLDGGGGDDVIFGGGGSDLITGGEGDDAIAGEGGEDANISIFAGLFGGPGDDLIDGGEGSSLIEGGTGNDILGGGSDFDFIFGDDSRGCDGALSDPGLDDDEIFGGGGEDFLNGCQGLDKIFGQGDDDTINGNTGNDVLRGNAGSDKLHGNDGSDKLIGGTRKDVLLGDGGNDTLFAADGVLDVVRGGPGGADEAKIDEGVDTVTGVEVFL